VSPAEWEAVRLSLGVGAISVLVSLPPALILGWLLARREFPGKTLLDLILHLPLVLPPVVTGTLLLALFAPRAPLGRLLDALGLPPLAFSWRGAALAAAVVGFPLLLRAIRLSIEAVDPRLEAAARTLGASPWEVFRRVTLPLARPGVLAGSLLMFARSLGEFGATIAFVGSIPGETRTLPLLIFGKLQVPGQEGAVWRLVLIATVIAAVALGASELLGRWTKGRSAQR
jgi:molybdate transport system permease protein